MSKKIESTAPIANRLLAALPAQEYIRLLPGLELVNLTFGEHIYERGEIIRFVYFLNSGIISLLAAAGDSVSLEVGIVGSEGMIGLPVFLGVKTSFNRAIVQGTGAAMRMKTADFLTECDSNGALPHVLLRFGHSLFAQASQSAVCYCFHSTEARLARWLLMTSDRMAADEFPITQEFSSNMLGVRREAVNKSAVILQQRELIIYSRGNLSIINKSTLKEAACACYEIIKEEENNFPTKKRR